MCNGCQLTGTSKKVGDFGGRTSGTDCDCNEHDKCGIVLARKTKTRYRLVADMKMEAKRPRRRPRLTWNDIVRRGMKSSQIREDYVSDMY